MIKNITTLQPRRHKYALGGDTARLRDRFGDVTGESYGAGKGLIGSTGLQGASMGLSTGAAIGSSLSALGVGAGASATATAAGAAAGAGTAAAGAGFGSALGPIGAAAGLLIGGIVGLLTGRKKRNDARDAAIEADRKRKLQEGRNTIMQDELELGDINLNTNPLNMYDTALDYDEVSMINPTGAPEALKARFGGRVKKMAAGGIVPTSSNTASVVGPSHEQGGVPYGSNAELEGGEVMMNDANNSYIFSDTLKVDGNRTFAEVAEPIMKHKGYLEDKIIKQQTLLGKMLELTDRSKYSIDRNTNAREAEKIQSHINTLSNELMSLQGLLEGLYNQQESMKAENGMNAEPMQELRYGGKTKRKYAAGGLFKDMGTTLGLTQTLGNFLGNVGVNIQNRKDLEYMNNLPVPKTAMQDRVYVDWDIDTSPQIAEINRQVRAMENYIHNNTSNSSIARQNMLAARIAGMRNKTEVKSNEYNQEAQLRNQGKQINAQIDAKNIQTRDENAQREYNKTMDYIVSKSKNRADLTSAFTQLGRDIMSTVQTKKDYDALRTASFINMLSNNEIRDYILNNMSDGDLYSMFGQQGVDYKLNYRDKKVKDFRNNLFLNKMYNLPTMAPIKTRYGTNVRLIPNNGINRYFN